MFPEGESRHLCFFFNTFVLMQIISMICSRKIHDEFNIFEKFFSNWVFLLVWGIIIGLHILLIEVGGSIFGTIGLSWEQWVIGIAIACTLFIIDALVKFIPDRFSYAIGKDTVFNEREIAAGRAPETKFDDA